MKTDASPGPEMGRPLPIPARIWKIAAVTGAGAFMAMLDSTVTNLALEAVRRDFATTLPFVQWMVSGYLVALAVSLPTAGWLGGRYGYGRVWACSLAVFVAASAACALAPGLATLVLARIVQGLAGGVMIPAGQAVIGSTAGRRQLGRLMGVLGLVVALGPALGPAAGGLLIEVASWRWLFWLNVPVGVVALLAARGIVPAGTGDRSRPLDWVGLVLLGSGLPLLLYGGMRIGSGGITGVSTMAVVLGAFLVVAFVPVSRRSESPLVDLRLLRRRSFAAAVAAAGLAGANLYAGLLLLPLYFQLAAGMDAARAGAMLLVMGLGSAAVLPVAGVLTDRGGAGPVVLAGVGLLVLATVPFLLPGAPAGMLLASILAARGVGLALVQMPATTAAYASVRAEEMGDAATLVNVVQRLGGAVGALGIAALLARAGGPDAYAWAFAVLMGLSLLAYVPARALRRSREDPPG